MGTRANWTRYHWLAVGACLVVFAAARLIASLVLEQVPHLEDEVAYLFQAQVFSVGKVYATLPPQPDCFHMPFIVDHEGRRFGKYPPGWPALLAIRVWMGQAWWVNAALAALTVALTSRLGREVGNGLLTSAVAAGLAATSPFLLLLSGSMMSHTACLAFVTAFLWCFRRTCCQANGHIRSRWALAAGLALGCAFAIRPFTAAAVAVPACLHTTWRLVRYREWRRASVMALGFALLALIGFYVNLLWMGDPLLPPYVLAWPFDRPGFGPGHGPREAGHTLLLGVNNVAVPLWLLASHLHGWPGVSLAFVVALFLFKPRRFWDVFLAATSLSLALAYGAYWATGDLFGPRYLHEGASALFILSAAGIVRVGRWVRGKGLGWWRAYRAMLVLLVGVNLFVYLPVQFRRYRGLYGITAKPREILEQADLHDTLVIVDGGGEWQGYAVPFSMNAPTLDGDVVYARECQQVEELIDLYAGRRVYTFDGRALQPRSGWR